MILLKLLKPGIKVKRYGVIILALIVLIAIILRELVVNPIQRNTFAVCIFILIVIALLFIIYKCMIQIKKSKDALINKGYLELAIDADLEELLEDERVTIKGPKIVVVGGGTGLSTMLRGLKQYTTDITAIVTVGDDGGGSGILREDLGMLPPGDIRNCILALADTEPLMEELLQYRFTEGRLKGQSFGNLFLAAMDGISDNFEDAVQKMSSVLAVKGKVLPVTLEDMVLQAELENGHIVKGESVIGEEVINQCSPIKKLKILPQDAKALDDALKAIDDADAIVLGPGSLYTSILPNLLVKDICKSIKKSRALKIYICNVMTQPGETQGFKASDHIKVLFDHCGKDIVDCIIANEQDIPKELKEKYAQEGSEVVELDLETLEKMSLQVVKGDLTRFTNNYVRHNAENLARLLLETIMEKHLLYDRKRILEYIYLSQKMNGKK